MVVMDWALFALALGLLLSRNIRHSLVLLALEGVLLGGITWFSSPLTLWSALVATTTITVKAGLIPAAMLRVMNLWPSEERRDHPLPIWAYLAAAAGALGVVHISHLLGTSRLVSGTSAFFCAFSSIYLGMVMIVARRHLLSQIVALVSVENGMVLLGVSLSGPLPTLLELGVLADLAIAVSLLLWTSHRIHSEFETSDVVALQRLKG